MKKYVLDTNVLVENPDLIKEYDPSTEQIIIPMVVLEELDRFKNGNDILAYNTRELVRNLEQLDGILYPQTEPHEKGKVDNVLLKIAQREEATLVTNDRILAIKAKSMGIKTELSRVETDLLSKLYTGFREVQVSKEVIDDFFILQELKAADYNAKPNEYLLFKSGSQSAIGKAKGKIIRNMSTNSEDYKIQGIKPRNIEQLVCLDALMDPDVPVVSLVGLAGSGKTLLAIAAGLDQIFGKKDEPKIYKRVIVTRPIQTVGNDIGFLPGTMEEKMDPWIGPIYDNLDTITGSDQARIDGWFEKGKIVVEAMAYIRGRSISDSFIIVDECQNISPHEIKTILTRVGYNTKIVLTGDIEQIDNHKLSKFSNGLTYMVERFKDHSLAAHVTLKKGERSEVASLAAKVL